MWIFPVWLPSCHKGSPGMREALNVIGCDIGEAKGSMPKIGHLCSLHQLTTPRCQGWLLSCCQRSWSSKAMMIKSTVQLGRSLTSCTSFARLLPPLQQSLYNSNSLAKLCWYNSSFGKKAEVLTPWLAKWRLMAKPYSPVFPGPQNTIQNGAWCRFCGLSRLEPPSNIEAISNPARATNSTKRSRDMPFASAAAINRSRNLAEMAGTTNPVSVLYSPI